MMILLTIYWFYYAIGANGIWHPAYDAQGHGWATIEACEVARSQDASDAGHLCVDTDNRRLKQAGNPDPHEPQ